MKEKINLMCSWDIYFKCTSNFQENLHVPQPKVIIHTKDSELTKHVWISLMSPSDADQNETNRLWDVLPLQAFKWSSRMDSCLIELHHNLLKCCLSDWSSGRWMCGNGCVYIDEETIIHCYRQIQIASPLTDRFFCWTGEAAHEQKLYFHSKLQTQTTVLVQYMSTLFMKQIKCHSCEWTLFLQAPETVTVGLYCLKLTYL